MSDKKTWTLTNVDERTWLDSFDLSSDIIAQASPLPWTIKKRTLHGGLTDGVDVIEVDNGAFFFTVVPTRGMGLWRGEYDGCKLGWRSPVKGPVNPAFVNQVDCGGLGWLQGFDEWMCRCGLASFGPPVKDVIVDDEGNSSEADLTLHGRIANTPANRVELEVTTGNPPVLTVVGVVEEAMLFFPQLRLTTRISTEVGSNRITVSDEIVNLKDTPAEFEILYHCNFGPPFMAAGSRLVSPTRRVAPRDPLSGEGMANVFEYGPPVPGFVEQVYWHSLASDADGNSLILLRNADGDRGAVLRFNVNELPCFTQWKNTAAISEGYVTGLEPGTAFPNPKTFERSRGRIITLEPGERYHADVTVEVHTTPDGVSSVEDEVTALLDGVDPEICPAPLPEWSVV
ncbi:MAG: aldose 1-epimerase family protein [Lentisphaerae bacterium]|jgi:hypothetical protein|nr:aldose 1-epimerase family protein [Lentisphaerota bacterium]MBT4816776.1 aldose 1-epimerase family protein [Lentisphaerota bacterium]MBT5607573.1 aldose 1-epimerase family protein [Lentisphaerota bacterium]MBT7054566.1 aldose 1-epimerase family protein [Lentisphaerota bacterium]MBT7845194.1 aldose 1-epimerase family protein [Lentisphaerota bacterium]